MNPYHWLISAFAPQCFQEENSRKVVWEQEIHRFKIWNASITRLLAIFAQLLIVASIFSPQLSFLHHLFPAPRAARNVHICSQQTHVGSWDAPTASAVGFLSMSEATELSLQLISYYLLRCFLLAIKLYCVDVTLTALWWRYVATEGRDGRFQKWNVLLFWLQCEDVVRGR